MGMRGTGNWVKDGLDSYLAVTGERRAERKADADLAMQNKQMELAENQDQRASKSADLTNQVQELAIGEGKRKVDDRTRFSGQLRDFITMKTAANPSIPNTLDPEHLATSRQEATDLAHTASMLNEMPAGAAELKLESLSKSAQTVLMEGPGKAAMLRKGTIHRDPSGAEYTITGQLGPVRVVKEEGKPTLVIPTMLAARADGTTIEVPYTENKSNDPNDPVKYVTPEMLMNRAGLQLASLDQAEKNGIIPAVAYSENIYRMVQALPYEQQVAWMQAEIGKETGKRDKYVSDAAMAAAAKPFEERLKSLAGTPEEKRTEAAAIMLGAPAEVVDHLLKTSKAVHEMFPDVKSTKTKIEEGAGGGQVREVLVGDKGERVFEGKPYSKHAPKSSGGSGGGGAGLSEKESRADIDKSTADFAKRRTDHNKWRLEVLKTGDPEELKLLDEATTMLETESASITEKMRRHKEAYGRDYTPTAVTRSAAPATGGGMRQTAAAPAVVKTAPAAVAPRGAGAVAPPAGFKPNGKTIGGKPAYVSADGKQIWTP